MPEQPIDDITAEIVHASYGIHHALGPGLLESVYEGILKRRLEARGLNVDRQKYVAFEFDGQHYAEGLRVDLLVERSVVVEVKSVETLLPVHTKQVLTYLRLLELRVGLLINFGTATMREGLRSILNNYSPAKSAPPLYPRLRVLSNDLQSTEQPQNPGGTRS